MIAVEKWAELSLRWEKIGPAYQIPRRSFDRLRHFCDHCVPLLKDRKVLEIGCNAGIFGYCIDEVAASYTGVEPALKVRDKTKKKPPKTDYFKQAQITLEEMSLNAKFLNLTIPEFCRMENRPEFNTFVACFALYHFMDKEIDDLVKYVFPKCDLVIIQNRCQDRPTPHNKYKFWKSKRVVKFFESLGYSCEVIGSTDRTGKQVFDEIICKRKHRPAFQG